ncbi:MAG: hypothetical protein E6I27_02320 [Chloroflexi bacterium]|nr:MAG: hypothetical protein E6I27_02320 [Chloroflexota bacterium]
MAVAVISTVLLAVVSAESTAADHSRVRVEAKLTASGGWLARFNAWRASSRLSQLVENATWSTGDYDHAVYMVKNDLVTHYETLGTPYYTTDGDTAARNSNIYVSSSTATSDEQAIDWWMQAPFHAMGMMDPRLTTTAFGSYRETKSGWDMGAAVDVLRGNPFTGGSYPVFFPGSGAVVPLTSFSGGESPNPLQACPGYAAPTGLPAFIEIGGNVATTVSAHSLTGNGVALAHCVIDSTNATFSSSLTSRGGVIVIPQAPLTVGVTYTVGLTVNGTPYSWSFGVNNTGTIGIALPSGWTSLGAIGTSSVAASSWGVSRTDVFVRGSDNALWHRMWNGSAWAAWESLGGVITSAPAAVSWSGNRIDILARGQDRALWHRFSNGTTWSGWERLGGALASGPAVASWASGRLDIFVQGTDGALWHKFWGSTYWSPWESLGGGFVSDPAAVSWGPNRVDIFIRGHDNALWQKTWNGQSWTGWASEGGILTSGPGVTSCASGRLDVFVAGSDHGLYRMGFNGSWGAWQGFNGYWTSAAGVTCPPGTTTVGIYELALDGAVATFSAPGT